MWRFDLAYVADGLLSEREKKALKNDILLMKFSEFYLCFHNSWQIGHLFSRAPMKIVFGVITVTTNYICSP